MNEIQILRTSELCGRQFTVYGTPEAPLFLAKEVAEIIDYSKTSEGYYQVSAMLASVDDDEKVTINILNSEGRAHNQSFLTEDGLYEVLMQSRKPVAKTFKKGVKQILHEVRTNGGYLATTTEDTPELIMAKALKLADATIKRVQEQNRLLTEQNTEMKPKALFADAVSSSKTSILVGELAKILNQNGIEIGQNRLFKWLREKKYLMSNNIPYQQYMEQELFEIKENSIVNPDGSIRITKTTKVTGKGQVYFINKFLNENKVA